MSAYSVVLSIEREAAICSFKNRKIRDLVIFKKILKIP